MTRHDARNMRLLAQHALDGSGNVGEGMCIQLTRDRRRVLWLAHESPPKNATAVDVTNPRKPAVIFQSDLPHARMRSNSLDVVGDILVIAYQTSAAGLTPAGFDILDVADPTRPRTIGFFDASGPASRGVHHLWFVDGSYVHCASGAPDFKPRNPRDDQLYRIVDIRRPSKPVEAGRWWLPGTRDGDAEPPPPREAKTHQDRCQYGRFRGRPPPQDRGADAPQTGPCDRCIQPRSQRTRAIQLATSSGTGFIGVVMIVPARRLQPPLRRP